MPETARAYPQKVRGDHWRHRDGKEKQPLTRVEAEHMVVVMERQFPADTYSSYRCRVCRCWHVGRTGRWAMATWRRERWSNERLHFLWPEIGERAAGCMKAENHPDAAKAGHAVRGRFAAAAKRRAVDNPQL